MTLPLPFGQVQLDPAAAAQQVAAVACVYQEGLADLVELFAPAEVVRFVWRDRTWPPSYALIRWDADQWLIVISGTTNLVPQVLGHIAGSFGRPGINDPVTVNGQWAAVWEEIRAEVNPIIGELPPTGRIQLSGHSYGAAVAAIGAVDFAGRYGGERIELLQIGSPRSFTEWRPAEFPHVWHRLESTYDPVTILPFSIVGVDVATDWVDPLQWVPRFPTWVHYGEPSIIYPNGQYTPPAVDPNPLPPGVTLNPIDAHRLRNYWGRLAYRFATDGGPEAYGQALTICNRVLLRPAPQTLSDELPRVVLAPTGSLVPVPDYNGIAPLSSQPMRFTMPLVPVLLDPPYFKLTHFFNWGKSGWDESYWCATSGGDNPMLSVVNAGIALAVIRRKALFSGAQYVGLRVSDAEPPHKSTPDKAHNIGDGTFSGSVNDAPLPTGSCVFVRAQDRTFTYDAERVYRGITREFLGTDNVNATKITPTPKMQQWLQQMTNFLQGTHGGASDPGGALVKFGIMATDRSPTVATSPVVKVDTDPDGYLRITASDVDFPAIVGQTVALSVNRTRCARGISGRWRVRARTTDATGRILTLHKRPCCPANSLADLMGTVRVVPRAMFQTYWFEFSGAGHRNTGGPNFSTAGRRPGQCC